MFPENICTKQKINSEKYTHKLESFRKQFCTLTNLKINISKYSGRFKGNIYRIKRFPEMFSNFRKTSINLNNFRKVPKWFPENFYKLKYFPEPFIIYFITLIQPNEKPDEQQK